MTRILVVEDEESFSEALGYLLGREGFDVTLADTGTKAIEEFDRVGADPVPYTHLTLPKKESGLVPWVYGRFSD